MPSQTSKQKETTNTNNRNVLEDAPLFAGLDDFVLIQAESKKTKRPPVEPVKEKKKLVAPQPKQAVQPLSPTSKTPRAKPSDPNAMLLSVVEMCALLKISRATLVRMDKSGHLPGRIKLGGSVRFHRETVETWLKSLINS